MDILLRIEKRCRVNHHSITERDEVVENGVIIRRVAKPPQIDRQVWLEEWLDDIGGCAYRRTGCQGGCLLKTVAHKVGNDRETAQCNPCGDRGKLIAAVQNQHGDTRYVGI